MRRSNAGASLNGRARTPHETPNPALGRLNAFVGEWEMQASVDGQPVTVAERHLNGWKEGPSSFSTRTVSPRDAPAQRVSGATRQFEAGFKHLKVEG